MITHSLNAKNTDGSVLISGSIKVDNSPEEHFSLTIKQGSSHDDALAAVKRYAFQSKISTKDLESLAYAVYALLGR